MVELVFHYPDRDPITISAPAESTVMRAAVINSVPGIVGECGGQAMCATCHVFVRRADLGKLPPIGDDEEDMLEFSVGLRDQDRSRLGCQIGLRDIDHLEVDVPSTQHSS